MLKNKNPIKLIKFNIAGMRFYDGPENMSSDLPLPFNIGEQLLLTPEPFNIHDSHAIAVYDKTNKYKLGYVGRNKNEEMYPYLNANKFSWDCKVTEDSSLVSYSEPDTSYFEVEAIVAFYSAD